MFSTVVPLFLDYPASPSPPAFLDHKGLADREGPPQTLGGVTYPKPKVFIALVHLIKWDRGPLPLVQNRELQ